MTGGIIAKFDTVLVFFTTIALGITHAGVAMNDISEFKHNHLQSTIVGCICWAHICREHIHWMHLFGAALPSTLGHTCWVHGTLGTTPLDIR